MRLARFRTACVWLATLAAPGPLAAELLYLPDELPLAALPLTVELTNAEIEVVVSARSQPLLRAQVLGKTGEDSERVALDVVLDHRSLTVRRAQEAGAVVRRLRLDLLVAPGQEVRFLGRDLVLRIDDPVAAAPRDTEARDTEADLDAKLSPAVFLLALSGSEAELSGVRNAVLEMTGSSVWIDDSGGSLALTLDGGSAEVRGHRGPVTLEAIDAEVVVTDLRGRLQPRLSGGRLEISDGDGRFAGTVEGATLVFDNWRGAAELRGADATIEARGGTGSAGPWTIEGRELHVVLDRIQAPIAVRLLGGSLDGTDLRGKLETTAMDGARVELTALKGPVKLELSGGAQARLTDVSGGLDAAVTDSRLEVDGVDRLTLTGARLEVVARRVARLSAPRLSDPDLELDLTEIRHNPFLQLLGTGRARVQLPTPCIVRTNGPEGLIDYSIEVTNCELRLPGQRVSRRQDHIKYGAMRPTQLTVTLDRDIDLEVEGEP